MTGKSDTAIPLPEASRDKHSLFATNANAARAWLQTVPRANLGEATRQLYQATSELNQVKCKGKERLEILETLRPDVHQAIQGLAQHYLSKPLNIPEKVEKIVSLANTLNAQLATGYALSFKALLQESRLLKPTEALSRALHRLITEYSRILLRTYQLHRSPSSGYWQKLHYFYQQGLIQKVLKHKTNDPLYGSGNVNDAYLRALLLSTSRPHQLPQRYLSELFIALSRMSNLVELRGERLESCAFLLDPKQDSAPQYRELINRAPTEGWLGMDTRPLTKQDGESSLFSKAPSIPPLLQERVILAWSEAADRVSDRQPCNILAKVAVGISASHYYIAREEVFETFKLNSKEATACPDPFLEHVPIDPWAGVPDTDPHEQKTRAYAQTGIDYKVPTHTIETIEYSLPSSNTKKRGIKAHYSYVDSRILDISDSGYRIQWDPAPNLKVRNGELMAVKSADIPEWSLAVVRWLRNEDHSQVGAEILATTATPYSARVLNAGQPITDYQRAALAIWRQAKTGWHGVNGRALHL
ncbi:hypothetical protein IMCC21906_03095 [Spongiibacter sp. IMCC21906]|uniref:hypothetical protein n=1 Tax=Spongiibacter sp. IMCC21906 TaxID=1620392 RepID=UPI00062E071F|nr:hypothetical protein [Spongiibacter sp. IMCC21906]AKH70735.1 hypothetical protein IMCC21906_03095 [Spongiibacter sp. IMCC21906]